ncbi:MAG: hypothetical protein M3P92_09150, partial [Actinomycetota bacterium]|nr:hypothetical protein [Actinomycetota bacterium]
VQPAELNENSSEVQEESSRKTARLGSPDAATRRILAVPPQNLQQRSFAPSGSYAIFARA